MPWSYDILQQFAAMKVDQRGNTFALLPHDHVHTLSHTLLLQAALAISYTSLANPGLHAHVSYASAMDSLPAGYTWESAREATDPSQGLRTVAYMWAAPGLCSALACSCSFSFCTCSRYGCKCCTVCCTLLIRRGFWPSCLLSALLAMPRDLTASNLPWREVNNWSSNGT